MKLEKKIVDGWKWQLKDPSALEPWFGNYRKYLRENNVKSNSLRTVFKVESNGKKFYVKYVSPKSLGGKLKARFAPQVKSEFEAAALLGKHSIPHVEYLGWGVKGNKGMLVSLELSDAVNARDFWFEHACADSKKKKSFLRNFAAFLKLFLSSGIYHPDFHIGNLLVKTETLEFFIVDPYGIKEAGKLSAAESFGICRIIGALRGELSDREAFELMADAGIPDAGTLWRKILKAEAEEIEKLWEKRKSQILKASSKYALRLEEASFIRNTMYGKPFISPGLFADEKAMGKNFSALELTAKEAENLWLDSFRLQFHRIEHPMPLARKSNILYFAKTPPVSFLSKEELSERCRMSGQEKRLKDVLEKTSHLLRFAP